jgi:hypothetical protein
MNKKKINEKNIKRQSTTKTKWDCQNLHVVSCGQDNLIEGKTWKK